MNEPPDAVDAVGRALEAVDRWEPRVHAFVQLDRARALAEARSRRSGALAGTVLGVKDIFDTADLPTGYGSSIYAGFRPRADAAAVALLRAAGATVLGKTVTAELACYEPGPTANPHRVAHTPGGSSSGSAAAVATGMVDVALGTQTAGSVVRPASYCGVFGFKPTFGTVATAGVKAVAPSLDTVGWLARDVALLDRVRVALTGRPPSQPRATPPRIAVARTAAWEQADADARDAVARAAELAAASGATVRDVELDPLLDALADEQVVVMQYEAARSLAWEHTCHADQLSAQLRALLDRGLAVDAAQYDAVRARLPLALDTFDRQLGDDDAVLTLAATGEAPAGLGATGDPRFARLWTLLGVPVVAVPGLVGATGLPIGVQLVGRRGTDDALLATAAWLAAALPPAPRPAI